MSKIIQFINEVRAEFKNISWPKKETLIQLTIVVISISIVTSLLLGGFDYLFTNSIAALGNINKKTQVESGQVQPVVTLPAESSSSSPIKQ